MQTILTGWNFMRWLRLVLSILIAIQAIQLHDTLAGLIAALFLFQVITNTGCGGATGCAVSSIKSRDPNLSETIFEDNKSK